MAPLASVFFGQWERVIDITGNEAGGYGNTFFYLNGSNSGAFLRRPRATRAQEVVDQLRKDLPDLFDEGRDRAGVRLA
jgi:monoamine oxidase/UDP-galactopyranose mutase